MTLLRTLVAALIPNGVFLLLGRFVEMPRAAINLDFFAVAALAPWLPAPVFVVLSAFALLVDAVESLSSSYYFNFADALSCVGDVVSLSPLFAFGIAALVLALAFLIASASRLLLRGAKPRQAAVLIGIAVLLMGIDFASGTNSFSLRQSTTARLNIAGSSGLRASRQVLSYIAELRQPTGSSPVLSATAPLLRNTAPFETQENVVLVVEESFGLMLDDAGRSLLTAPFREARLLDRYEIVETTVPFHGSTVAGEFRELCGREVGLRARGANAADLSACLPAIFHRAGFRTTALHGFTSRMFERNRWYPRFGFDEQFFRDELARLGLPECGFAFRGICDEAIAAHVADRLATAREPQFVYWLTLNAHLPVDHSVAVRSSFDCRQYAPARDNPDVCDWMRVTISTNEALARLAFDARLPRTRFIIVGDHAPPFLARSKRDLFSQQRVPAIELRPRQAAPVPPLSATSGDRHRALHPR